MAFGNIIHGGIVVTTTTLYGQMFGTEKGSFAFSMFYTSNGVAGLFLSYMIMNLLDKI